MVAPVGFEEALQQAAIYLAAGRFQDAERICRMVLQVRPDHTEASELLRQLTNPEPPIRSEPPVVPQAATAALPGAVQPVPPKMATLHTSPANTVGARRKVNRAEISRLLALADKLKHVEAEALARELTAQQSDFGVGWQVMGTAILQQGRHAEAIEPLQRAIRLLPGDAGLHSNLAVALMGVGRLGEAEVSSRRALQLQPSYIAAHNNLGLALKDQGRPDEAESCFRRALKLNPKSSQALNNLGLALRDLGRLQESVTCFQQALAIKPRDAEAHMNFGVTLSDLGEAAQAHSHLRQAVALSPGFAEAHGNLLYATNYHPDINPEQLYGVYQAYDAQVARPLLKSWPRTGRAANAGRRLKIGYVSPDFRRHSCRHFLLPLMAHHDRQVVEVYAYAELAREDAVTAQYRRSADHWVSTKGMSHDALAQRIHADGIDILVDVAGHTQGNRLQVFARKPSPVSVSWLGYGYTTGVSAIDHYLTDWQTVPAGGESLFCETPWRLDAPSLAYRADDGMGPVSALPAAARGVVTFGCLTRAVRINHRVVRAWSDILKRVPGARLVLDSRDFRDASMQDAFAAKFAAHGIARERLDIGYHSPPWDVLRGIDISLDCFPHNCGTTLFESLYMGVPFVGMAGRPGTGRIGAAILHGLGRAEWLAQHEAQYVDLAVDLAADLPRLGAIRSGLRAQLQACVLMDEAGFARRVERAYQQMWERSAAQG